MKTAGPNLSPTATQLHQPSKKVTGNKEDRPMDGKTTSTSTHNQTDPTETTTITRATWLGSLRRKIDTTITTTQPTTGTTKQQVRLKSTSKKKTTPKTTKRRCSSSLNESTVSFLDSVLCTSMSASWTRNSSRWRWRLSIELALPKKQPAGGEEERWRRKVEGGELKEARRSKLEEGRRWGSWEESCMW